MHWSTSARSASTCPTSPRRSAAPCVWTPTSSSSAKCATWRRSQAAITAAETGHIVFGTLHTNSAEGTVNRIIDVFPKEQQDQIRTQLSVAIIGILSQALLPRKPKGLVAAYEMLVVTPAISNLIRENKTYRIDSSIQTGRKHGMILLDDSLFNLWRQGLVEENEVMFKSRKPNDLRERIENAKKGIFDDEPGEDEEED